MYDFSVKAQVFECICVLHKIRLYLLPVCYEYTV